MEKEVRHIGHWLLPIELLTAGKGSWSVLTGRVMRRVSQISSGAHLLLLLSSLL